MEKRILTVAIFSVLCSLSRAFNDDKDYLEHVRTCHRCYRDGGDIGYVCALCWNIVVVPGKEVELEDGTEVVVVTNRESYRSDCWYCRKMFPKEESGEKRYGPAVELLRVMPSFYSESDHIERFHDRCFFCFGNFRGLSEQEREVHLWKAHSVCKACDYENVGNKKDHLEKEHVCSCSNTGLIFQHGENCSARLAGCEHGLWGIEHFREKHRCNKKCEIRYNFGAKRFEIFHGCRVKCPECLLDVCAFHMDKTEKCSEKCRSNGGKWEHDRGCRHWVQCKLCADEVCATPLHMQEIHGCGLQNTKCCKEGKTWIHGESCPILWYSGYESNRAFGDGEEFMKYVKGLGCSCKIINPSKGHEEGCPCRQKRCPISGGCVVFGSIESHVKVAHKEYGLCPGCKEWWFRNDTSHMWGRHKCSCRKSLEEVHDKGCPCFLRCPFCKTPVSWEHMREIHGCGSGCEIFRPIAFERDKFKSLVPVSAKYSDWRCFEGCVDRKEAKNSIPPCKNYLQCPICERKCPLSLSHMQDVHHCIANCGMREISDGKNVWMHADGCPTTLKK